MNYGLNQWPLPPLKVNEWIPVEPIHCHQRFPENALISHVRATSEDRIFAELRCKFDTDRLTFFYDHKIDHLPGMLEACAHRQASLVLAHIIYGIPLNWVALLDWMNIRLFNYGELDTSTIIKAKLLNSQKSTHKVEFELCGLMVQADYPVMEAKGKLVMFSPSFAKRIRHKKAAFDAYPELIWEYYGLKAVDR